MLWEEPICQKCKHYDREKVNCSAFPKGIPFEILEGDNNHSKPLPEQKNKIVFEPKPKDNSKLNGTV
jgi:hypothetical protein